MARGLFELRLSFDAFIEMMRTNVSAACQRVMDAAMLEKIKQARASAFQGLNLAPGAPTPEELSSIEAEISGRYPAAEFKNLKRHGFTGMNVEQRAKQSRLSNEYDIIYRNFSRNVHSTDFTELFIQEDPALVKSSAEYIEQRDTVSYEVAFISVLGVVMRVNALVHLGLDRRIRDLLKARERIGGATHRTTTNGARKRTSSDPEKT